MDTGYRKYSGMEMLDNIQCCKVLSVWGEKSLIVLASCGHECFVDNQLTGFEVNSKGRNTYLVKNKIKQNSKKK